MTMDTTTQYLTIASRMDEDALIASFGKVVHAFEGGLVEVKAGDLVSKYEIIADPAEYDPCLWTVKKTKTFLGLPVYMVPPTGWYGVLSDEQLLQEKVEEKAATQAAWTSEDSAALAAAFNARS